MSGLTRAQADCLSAIRRLMTDDGVPPSYEELRQAMGLSSRSGIHRLLVGLKDRGVIRWSPDRARSIEIVARRPSLSELGNMPTLELEQLEVDVQRLLAERNRRGL